MMSAVCNYAYIDGIRQTFSASYLDTRLRLNGAVVGKITHIDVRC